MNHSRLDGHVESVAILEYDIREGEGPVSVRWHVQHHPTCRSYRAQARQHLLIVGLLRLFRGQVVCTEDIGGTLATRGKQLSFHAIQCSCHRLLLFDSGRVPVEAGGIGVSLGG